MRERSARGSTSLTGTPSKRNYKYIDVIGATEMVMDDEIADLFV